MSAKKYIKLQQKHSLILRYKQYACEEYGPLWAHRDFGYLSEEGLAFSWKWQLFSFRLAKGWWDEKPSWCICPDRCLRRTHSTDICISMAFWICARSWLFCLLVQRRLTRQISSTFGLLALFFLLTSYFFLSISLTFRRLRTWDFKSWSPHSVGLSGSVDISANACAILFFKNLYISIFHVCILT